MIVCRAPQSCDYSAVSISTTSESSPFIKFIFWRQLELPIILQNWGKVQGRYKEYLDIVSIKNEYLLIRFYYF